MVSGLENLTIRCGLEFTYEAVNPTHIVLLIQSAVCLIGGNERRDAVNDEKLARRARCGKSFCEGSAGVGENRCETLARWRFRAKVRAHVSRPRYSHHPHD